MFLRRRDFRPVVPELCPDMAFGSNVAGSEFGGRSESFSTLLGFQCLLLLASAFLYFVTNFYSHEKKTVKFVK
jgi:hypothetical protein